MNVLKQVTLFFASLLLLSSCSDMETCDLISLPIDKCNAYAARFVKSINRQPEQLHLFHCLTESNNVLYDYAGILLQHDYGMCYFIPVADCDGKVTGAIYCPVSYNTEYNSFILLTDTLHDMYLVDADFIKVKTPTERRFLYSHPFATLARQGLAVDNELTAYDSLQYKSEKIKRLDNAQTHAAYYTNYLEIRST